MKTRQMGAIPPSAILSQKGVARYGGVSRTGPLRIEMQEEIHHFAGWEGGGLVGTKIVNKNVVNKRAFS